MKTNYILIDFENVIPEKLDLLDQEWIQVMVFVGKTQTKIPLGVVKAMQKLGERVQYIEMSGTGHNALDFHIAYYIGKISAMDKDAYFHIVSADQGFDPLIAHLKTEGVFSDRVTKIEDIPIVAQSCLVDKSLEERIQFVVDHFGKCNSTRPRSRKTLLSHIGNLFLKKLSTEEIGAVVEGLFSAGIIRENGKRIEYGDEE